MQELDFATLGALLFLASLVAIASRRLNLPYSVGLVAAGIALAFFAPGIAPLLGHDLIFYVLLPPLVFEAAIQIPWRPFRRELPLLLALVTIGVALAAIVVAAGMHWLVDWSWLGAGLFGVLIAATDPVAVIAAFKSMRVPSRLHLLVEGESLLNDGVAAVGFAVLLEIAVTGNTTTVGIGLHFLGTVLGGVAAGAAVSLPLIAIAGRAGDRLVEVTLTMLIAYGAFILAERFGASGILATVTAGLIVGNYGFLGSISDDGREGVLHHWEYIAFVANSLIFILIGGRETAMPILAVIEAAGMAVALTLAGRAISVYSILSAFTPTRLRVPRAYQHILFWGGLRGALALALALTLPPQIPEHGTIVTVAFAVVAFSVFVQGLTMPWLLRALRVCKKGGAC